MIRKRQTYRIFIFAVVLFYPGFLLLSADRYSVVSGDWNATTTWSETSGGTAGATVPVAGDNVYIEDNHTITVTADAGCATITFTQIGAAITVDTMVSLTVSGSITLDNQSTSSTECTISGAGTISCTDLDLGSPANIPSGYDDVYTHMISSTVANLNISGNLDINNYYVSFKTAGDGVFSLESGTVSIGGQIRGINQDNKNVSTFIMTAGNGSGILNLSGTSPFDLSWNKDVIGLNGATSQVNFSSTGDQELFNTDYTNITLSGSGIKTFPNQGTPVISGILSMEGEATVDGKAPSYGDSATLQYRGSVAQSTGTEFPATFSGTGGVIIDNLNGVNLTANRAIGLLLNFVNGLLITGTNTLTLGPGCIVNGAGTGNYVFGNLEKGIGTATSTKTFEIGNDSVYTPVILDFTGTTNGTGAIVVNTTPGDHPQIASSSFNPAYTVNRYWTITNNGVTGYASYDATFYFDAGDLDPGTDPVSLSVGNYNLPTWTYPLTGTRRSSSIQATGLTTFGDFQIGTLSGAYRSAVSGSWEAITSWEYFTGAGWVAATTAPSSANNSIAILSPHSITTSTTFSVDELTIEEGATLTLGTDMTVADGAGTDINVNGTLDCGGLNILSGAGSFVLNDSAEIIVGSPEGITISGATGNIQTSSRTFDTAANYTYNGIDAQVTGNGLPAQVDNLTIDNFSGVSLTGSVTINGTLTLSNGALFTGPTTLIFQNSDLPVSRGSGTISTDISTDIYFGTAGNTGGAAFTIPAGTFTTAPTINNLTVTRINSLTLNDQNLSIAGILLCNGPLITAGNLTLLSNASGTALIDGSGTGDISGSVTMQRYLSNGFGYNYFSSPFQGATVSEFGDDMDLSYWFPTVYAYDESKTTSGWVSYTDPAGVLEPMRGYAVNFGSVTAPNTVDASGEVNNGPLSLSLYNNNNTYTQGLNLVGNPYPSPVDWDAGSGWTRTNIDNAIYYFKASDSDEYGGTYSSYINGVSSDGVVSNIIPSMQGFFVHVSDGAYPVTGTLAMNNNVRITDKTHVFTKSTRSVSAGSKSYPLIRIRAAFVDNMENADLFVVYFCDKVSSGFDNTIDALKLFNTDLDVPNLYAILPGDYKLSINALSCDQEIPVSVPLGIKLNRPGQLSFKLEYMDDYFSRFDLFISDSETGDQHRLPDDSGYSVYMEAGEYNHRFYLDIRNFLSEFRDISDEDDLITIYSSDGHLNARINDISWNKGVLSLYNITGQLIFSHVISAPGEYQFTSPGKEGIYIVSYVSGLRQETNKIFIEGQ